MFKLLSSLPCPSFSLLYQRSKGSSGHLAKCKYDIYYHRMCMHIKVSAWSGCSMLKDRRACGSYTAAHLKAALRLCSSLSLVCLC